MEKLGSFNVPVSLMYHQTICHLQQFMCYLFLALLHLLLHMSSSTASTVCSSTSLAVDVALPCNAKMAMQQFADDTSFGFLVPSCTPYTSSCFSHICPTPFCFYLEQHHAHLLLKTGQSNKEKVGRFTNTSLITLGGVCHQQRQRSKANRFSIPQAHLNKFISNVSFSPSPSGLSTFPVFLTAPYTSQLRARMKANSLGTPRAI